jgi:RNA polymerase sigma factor (TIGR02999 family)
LFWTNDIRAAVGRAGGANGRHGAWSIMNDVTGILSAIEQGDPTAAGQLLPLVNDELRKLAAHKLTREQPGQTLDATAPVHEAYLRLVGDQQFDSRAHFFAAAAEAMRRILVERARRRNRLRHGGGRAYVDLEAAASLAEAPSQDLEALDVSLNKLAAEDPAPSARVSNSAPPTRAVLPMVLCIMSSHQEAFAAWPTSTTA